MVFSVQLHFDLKIGCLGNWVRRFGFVFTVLRMRGIVSRNVFKQSRKTVRYFRFSLRAFCPSIESVNTVHCPCPERK